ncbi:MAG: low molecular weight protein-tyrosine-phosphatase [Nocardioidaceae bacterium]
MTAEHGGSRLPEPRLAGRGYRVTVVCLGNICRSPIAQVVLTSRLHDAGLGDRVRVDSAGTGDWHVGQPMDRRASAALVSAGYDAEGVDNHRARRTDNDWLESRDLVLAMDGHNHTDLLALGVPPERLRMFRDFDPGAGPGDRDVPDPYYREDEGFAEVVGIIERSSEVLVGALAARVPG